MRYVVDVLTTLYEKTHVVEYSPNVIPNKYLVRLVGLARIDKKPLNETQDAVGWGKTLKEAARMALEEQEKKRKERTSKFRTSKPTSR